MLCISGYVTYATYHWVSSVRLRNCRWIVWVCLYISWGWRLNGCSKIFFIFHIFEIFFLLFWFLYQTTSVYHENSVTWDTLINFVFRIFLKFRLGGGFIFDSLSLTVPKKISRRIKLKAMYESVYLLPLWNEILLPKLLQMMIKNKNWTYLYPKKRCLTRFVKS